MKELSGTATDVASAPIDACFARLADIESYPSWYPEGVGRAIVLERDTSGIPATVDATLKISRGPLSFDRPVPLAVSLQRPVLVRLERVPDDTHDREQLQVIWRLRELASARTELTVEMRAQLDLPSFLPGVGRIAEDVAQGFLGAALRLLGR